MAAVSGTAVSPVRYQYAIEQDTDGTWRQFTLQIKLDSLGGTNEWTKTYTDGAGRAYKTVYAAYSGAPCSISYYNANGQLTNTIDPDGVSTLYAYNPKGEQVLTVLDMNTNHVINFSGTDRITFTTNNVATDHGATVRRTQVYAWNTSGNSSNLVSTTEASTTGLMNWSTTWNNGLPVTSQAITTYGANGNRWLTNVAPDNSYTVSAYLYGLLVSVTRYDSAGAQLGATSYDYDPHGRQYSVADTRNGATTNTFNNADQLATVTTPAPGPGQAPQITTTTYYDTSLRATNIVQPDGTSVANTYDPRGLLLTNSGSRTYPVAYTYDAQGRMKTMTTWQNYSNRAGASTTTWNYDSYRGWLTYKNYNGAGWTPFYTYTPAGRLQTRTWFRGVTTTYAYNNVGALSAVTYSDSTPALGYCYNRLGRQTAVTNGAALTLLSYNDAGQLLAETNSAGPLAGLAVASGYDQLLRRTSLALQQSGNPFVQQSFGFDAASRLLTASDGANNTATYSYLANSPLVGQITFANNGTTRMTTTKQYDALNRLTQISTVNGGLRTVDLHAYGCNSASQRTSMTNADNWYWVYAYDPLGQLTNAHKYWGDGSLVSGQQFQYQFDTIGNRTGTDAGGDQTGANLRHANYTVNGCGLNQYRNRVVPGYVQSLGTASPSANVALWSTNGSYAQAFRKGAYFRAELPVANANGPLWLALTNMALLPGGSSGTDVLATATGNFFVAQTPEWFQYRPGWQPAERWPLELHLGRRKPADQPDQPGQRPVRLTAQAGFHL